MELTLQFHKSGHWNHWWILVLLDQVLGPFGTFWSEYLAVQFFRWKSYHGASHCWCPNVTLFPEIKKHVYMCAERTTWKSNTKYISSGLSLARIPRWQLLTIGFFTYSHIYIHYWLYKGSVYFKVKTSIPQLPPPPFLATVGIWWTVGNWIVNF